MKIMKTWLYDSDMVIYTKHKPSLVKFITSVMDTIICGEIKFEITMYTNDEGSKDIYFQILDSEDLKLRFDLNIFELKIRKIFCNLIKNNDKFNVFRTIQKHNKMTSKLVFKDFQYNDIWSKYFNRNIFMNSMMIELLLRGLVNMKYHIMKQFIIYCMDEILINICKKIRTIKIEEKLYDDEKGVDIFDLLNIKHFNYERPKLEAIITYMMKVKNNLKNIQNDVMILTKIIEYIYKDISVTKND